MLSIQRIPILLLIVVATTGGPAIAQSVADLQADVTFLASPDLDGRMTGTDGESAAAEYIADRLEALGARPLPGQPGFLVPFEFTAGVDDAGSTLAAVAGEQRAEWSGEESIRGLSFSENGRVSGPVIFAGYGITVPEGQDLAYDSYATLDVEDKIVLVLRYFPEDADDDTRGVLARYSGLRFKAMRARELGAKALLLVTGPRSPNAGETIPMSFDAAIAGSGLVAASISGDVAAALFTAVEGWGLEEAQASFDDANPHAVGFDIPGVELTLEVDVEKQQRTGHNVLGYLPGDDADEAKDYVVLGAHFDHLGRGAHGNSLADKEQAGEVHHGADDNASGVAAVLAAGRSLVDRNRGRHVVLAFWSGEELGLLGSGAFINGESLAPDEIAGYVNLDMVGRVRDNKLTIQAAGSSPAWAGLIERSNVPIGLDLSVQEDPYLPTDSSTFNLAGIPSLQLFSGSHEDYHKPSDTADKINYEGLDDASRLAASITGKLANAEMPPEFVKVAPRRDGGGGRDTVRVYTGTIPDYATEVAGLLLSGVVAGGPADEAGLQGKDVIVEIAGREIANVYDYTYALDVLKVGQPTKVVFLRDGKRMDTTITPRARK